MQEQKRQPAAIIFKDIVGYSALMQRNEVETVAKVKRYVRVFK